jgi:hypothetical protein
MFVPHTDFVSQMEKLKYEPAVSSDEFMDFCIKKNEDWLRFDNGEILILWNRKVEELLDNLHFVV